MNNQDLNSGGVAQLNSIGPDSSAEAGSPTLGRRPFLKKIGLFGAAIGPVGTMLTNTARAESFFDRGLTRGDVAILRFLAAAEILETDLWQQYTELALGNESF